MFCGNILLGIFSKGINKSQTSIHSKTGELSTIDDAIILDLYDGEIHELDLNDYGNYRRIEFVKHKITIPADDLFLNRRDTTSRSDREMTIPMILDKRTNINDRINIVNGRIGRAFLRIDMDSLVPPSLEASQLLIDEEIVRFSSDSSNTADSEYDDFYTGYYIETVDNGGSAVYAKIEDPDSNDANVKGYISSSKRLSVKAWYDNSALTGDPVTPTISNNTIFSLIRDKKLSIFKWFER